jgi:hypothetical protein
MRSSIRKSLQPSAKNAEVAARRRLTTFPKGNLVPGLAHANDSEEAAHRPGHKVWARHAQIGVEVESSCHLFAGVVAPQPIHVHTRQDDVQTPWSRTRLVGEFALGHRRQPAVSSQPQGVCAGVCDACLSPDISL